MPPFVEYDSNVCCFYIFCQANFSGNCNGDKDRKVPIASSSAILFHSRLLFLAIVVPCGWE